MASMRDGQVVTQAQIDELWQEAYQTGFADAKRELEHALHQLKPLAHGNPVEVMPTTPQVPDSTSLDVLGLRGNILKPLLRAGYETIGDLVSRTEDDILVNTRDIGPAGIVLIKHALRRFGYQLARRQPERSIL